MSKKIVSLLLIITLCFSLITPAFAAGAHAMDTPDCSEEALRVSDEFAAAYPEGSFNLISVSVETHEYSGSEAFDIIRQGGSSGKVEVTIKAIDVSANIGLDYRITVPAFLSDKQINGTDSVPLLGNDQTEVVSTYNVGASTTADDIAGSNGSYNTGPAAEAYDVDITPEQQQSSPRNGLRAARERATGVASDRNKFSAPTKEEYAALSTAAAAAEDFYAQAPGTEFTITFGDGDRVKHFNMIIIDDDIPEWDEQVIFVITGVSGDGAVGLQKETTVNIIDNEPYEQPLIGFSAFSYTAYGDSAEITLTRTTGVNYYAGANICTVADSARPGDDYTELNQNILFIPGQTEMKITVPILKHDSSADKYFYIRLEPNESCSVYGAETVRIRIPKSPSTASGFDMLMLSGNAEEMMYAAGDGSDESVTLGVQYITYRPNDFSFTGDSRAGRSKTDSIYEVRIEHDSMAAGLAVSKGEGFRKSTLQSVLTTVRLSKIKKERNFDV